MPNLFMGRRNNFFCFIQNNAFYPVLYFIPEFISLTTEKLNSIMLKRIMRSGNHHPRVKSFAPHQICNRRCGNHPCNNSFGTHTANTCNQCCLQNITRNTGIFSNNDPGFSSAVPSKYICPRSTNMKCQFRCQFFIRYSSDTICSKQSTHCYLLRYI